MWSVFFGVLLSLMLVGIASFELLVHLLFTNHPVDWRKAGEPPALGSGLPKSLDSWIFARRRVQKQFLFRVPAWVREHSIAYWVLMVHKVSVILFLSGTVGFLIAALLLS